MFVGWLWSMCLMGYVSLHCSVGRPHGKGRTIGQGLLVSWPQISTQLFLIISVVFCSKEFQSVCINYYSWFLYVVDAEFRTLLEKSLLFEVQWMCVWVWEHARAHTYMQACARVHARAHTPLGHRTRELSWKNYRPEAGGGKQMQNEAALWYLRLLTMPAFNTVHWLTNFLSSAPSMVFSYKQTLEMWLALQTFRHLEVLFFFFKSLLSLPSLNERQRKSSSPRYLFVLAWFKHWLWGYLSIKYITEGNRNDPSLRCFRWQFLLYTASIIQDNTDLLWSLKRF